MAYEKQEWKNGEDGDTPITAERLNHMEQGIKEKAAQGPKGDKGDKGDDGTEGAKGDKGNKGDPGFPTEEQWNELVGRVEKLEGGTE